MADQQQYDNNMRGVLFVNDKGENPKRPDYRGECEIGGKQYRVSGWKRTSPKAGTFLSLAFDEAQPMTTPTADSPATSGDDMPF